MALFDREASCEGDSFEEDTFCFFTTGDEARPSYSPLADLILRSLEAWSIFLASLSMDSRKSSMVVECGLSLMSGSRKTIEKNEFPRSEIYKCSLAYNQWCDQ